MLRRATLGLLVVTTLAVAVGLFVFAGGPTESGGTGFASPQSGEFDSTVFRIVVYESGDARWIVEHRQTLSTEDEEAQFREYAERFRTEDTETYRNFRVRAETLTDSGMDTTGREMNATDFERNASVNPLGQTTGVVQMSFRWDGFASAETGAVIVADVFGGGWGIVEDQRLTIQAGTGVVFDDAAPEPDSMTVTGNLTASESVTWFGERQFADERPRVVLAPPSKTGSVNDTPTPMADDSPSDDGDDSSMGLPFVILAVLLLLGAGGGVMWFSGILPRSTLDSEESADRTTDTSGTSSPPEPAVPQEELLSDDDRVLQLLEENGGRMKQVSIVEETDWSKSKVSMLLSDMEEDDCISKLRVGRENIISIAGEEPDAAGSPFEEE